MQPSLAKSSVGIVVLSLLDRVESPNGAGVVAYASQVGPISPIASRIVVKQLRLKVCGSIAPIDAEVVDQVGR